MSSDPDGRCEQGFGLDVRMKQLANVKSYAPLVRNVRAFHQSRLLAVVFRKQLLQVLDLRQIVEGDIGLIRMQRQVVLMVCLGRKEFVERGDLGDDRPAIGMGALELRDIGFSDLLLLAGGREDSRTVLRARVRALAVYF